MKRAIITVFYLLATVAGMDAKAQASQTCELLEDVASLPVSLTDVRQNRLDAQDFDSTLIDVVRAMANQQQMLVFKPRDQNALRSVVKTVRRDWALGRMSAGRSAQANLATIPDAAVYRLNKMLRKYGCNPRLLRGRAVIFGFVPHSVATVLAAFLAIGALLATYGFSRLIKRERSVRKICCMPALLRYDGTCTVSTVLDFGRGGAKVKAPEGGFGTGAVSLHLAGHSIPARVAWENGMFAGLAFHTVQSKELVREILDARLPSSQPENLTEKAPACFKPGCHSNCLDHRGTVVEIAVTAPARS